MKPRESQSGPPIHSVTHSANFLGEAKRGNPSKASQVNT